CAAPGRYSNIHTIKIVDISILFIEAPPAVAACALTAREQQARTHWPFNPLALLEASCSGPHAAGAMVAIWFLDDLRLTRRAAELKEVREERSSSESINAGRD